MKTFKFYCSICEKTAETQVNFLPDGWLEILVWNRFGKRVFEENILTCDMCSYQINQDGSEFRIKNFFKSLLFKIFGPN